MNNLHVCRREKTCERKQYLDSSEIYYRCLRGDQEAWDILYRIIYKNVGKFTQNNTLLRVDSVEDMAQEIVCFLLSGAIDKAEKPGSFFGFVKTLTWRRIQDRIRKKIPLPIPMGANSNDDTPDWDPPCTGPGPEPLVRGNFLLEDIARAISLLPEKCHIPLKEYISYKKDGKYASYKQLARKMNMKLGTLSSRITRCLKELSMQPDIRAWLEV